MTDLPLRPRLSAIEAAWVIARRDFVAVLFSRAFLFFLLGPLFPVIVGGLAGSIGGEVQRDAVSYEVGVAMSPEDTARMVAAGERLAPQLPFALPRLQPVPEAAKDPAFDARAFMEARRGNYAAILTGTPQSPRLVGTEGQIARWQGPVSLIAGHALAAEPAAFPPVSALPVTISAADERTTRVQTAQIAQMLLFLLTMLLAGMVLSNLVEEKANKIIEILAAAIPMDAVFMGKLFAMLAVSFVGITVWGLAGFALFGGAGDVITRVTGFDITNLPAPAVGWPLFVVLGVLYFAMAYLLLGALFLTIGSMATSVREVQTLSMPVTMLQLMVFFLAAYTIKQPGSGLEMAAIAFPLSSPFAMLARAAMEPMLWTHALALAWQAVAVLGIVKAGSLLFRKRVMKSGGAGRDKRRAKDAKGLRAAA
ncbi:ABC transporter permease [Erythrobacter sp. CCH5-A1]|uniref:ABC transporter permease n=1 Tax=Erythrobacter sp. CCH5-A1 TaxID=1768792 RepID=UPI000833011E|nr:ABC transporter permease [Erythrobacter sp. CCH5-A1]